jgi:hypothetical protein
MNADKNDKIPMGKAICIIILVIFSVVALMGGIIFFVLGGSQNSQGGSSLVGRWELWGVSYGDADERLADNDEYIEFHFLSDGTGITIEGRSEEFFTWTSGGGRLVITSAGAWGRQETMTLNYSVSRSELRLFSEAADARRTMIFRRIR